MITERASRQTEYSWCKTKAKGVVPPSVAHFRNSMSTQRFYKKKLKKRKEFRCKMVYSEGQTHSSHSRRKKMREYRQNKNRLWLPELPEQMIFGTLQLTVCYYRTLRLFRLIYNEHSRGINQARFVPSGSRAVKTSPRLLDRDVWYWSTGVCERTELRQHA